MAISNIGPSWTLGDRLAKARREAGIRAQEMADIFEVSRNSISAWEHDTVEVKASTVRRWAEVTGVSPAWLLHTEVDGDGEGPYRAPAAGAAALALPHERTRRAKERPSRAVMSRAESSPDTDPEVLVTLSRRSATDNESFDPCGKPGCNIHHAGEDGKAA